MREKTIQRLKERLRKLRKRHHLTQEAFAEIAGISYKYYQAVEEGTQLNPRLSTLDKIATVYGIEVVQLIAVKMPKSRLVKKKLPKPPHYRRARKISK